MVAQDGEWLPLYVLLFGGGASPVPFTGVGDNSGYFVPIGVEDMEEFFFGGGGQILVW